MKIFSSRFNVVLAALIVVVCSYTAFAQVQSVKASNLKKCVQYFTINGQMYCASKPLIPPPTLTEAQNNEPNDFNFDGRKWQLGWWNQNTRQPMLEYTLASETVDNWTELVTSHYFPGLQAKLSPEQFMKAIMSELVKKGFQPKIKVYSKATNSLLYEWRIENHPTENQVVLTRIISQPQGLYALEYASRPTMSEERRNAWVAILSQARPKP